MAHGKKAAMPLEIVLTEEQLAGIIEEAARLHVGARSSAGAYPAAGTGATTSFPGLSTAEAAEAFAGFTPVADRALPCAESGGPAVREEIREALDSPADRPAEGRRRRRRRRVEDEEEGES